jgi:hypothetical protein
LALIFAVTGRIMDAGRAFSTREARVFRIERHIRAVVNPASSAVTRWWCHSALRHMLTGYGPTARQRRRVASRTPSAQQMNARAAAIDQLLGKDR